MTADSGLYALHRLQLTPETADEPLYACLARALPGLARHAARKAILAGLVRVSGRIASDPNQPVAGPQPAVADFRQGVRAAWNKRRHEGRSALEQPFTVLHEDGHLVVVDKAAGVLSVPSQPGERGAVPELLRRMWRRRGRDAAYIGTVHRLDKDTSGCLCFVLTREAQRLVAAQFAGEAAGRTYRCLVQGVPRGDAGEVRGKQGRGRDGRRAMVGGDEAGVEAVTRWKVLRRLGAVGAELEVELGTGRTHQIRVALAGIGLPVWGDRVYGHDRARPIPGLRAPRLMLHAWRLGLDRPGDGRRLVVEAPLPQAYTEFAAKLAEHRS